MLLRAAPDGVCRVAQAVGTPSADQGVGPWRSSTVGQVGAGGVPAGAGVVLDFWPRTTFPGRHFPHCQAIDVATKKPHQLCFYIGFLKKCRHEKIPPSKQSKTVSGDARCPGPGCGRLLHKKIPPTCHPQGPSQVVGRGTSCVAMAGPIAAGPLLSARPSARTNVVAALLAQARCTLLAL